MPQPDFIADTSALVRRLRNDLSVEPFFAGKRFAISFVTLAELSLGVLKAQNPEAAWKRVLEVLRGVEMFLVSDITPTIYAGVYHDLEQRGSIIPINDIWIAAVCLEARLPVLARDEHFHRVPNLMVIKCSFTFWFQCSPEQKQIGRQRRAVPTWKRWRLVPA